METEQIQTPTKTAGGASAVERRVRANAGYGFLHRTLHKMKLLFQWPARLQPLPPEELDLLRTEIGGIVRVREQKLDHEGREPT